MISSLKHSRLTRVFGYSFWTFGEQVMSIGVPRLLLFPIAAYLIGKESFGVFITALSISSIIGVTPSHGLSTGLFRNLTKFSEDKHGQYCQTALYMSHTVMIYFILASMPIILIIGLLNIVDWTLLNCLIALMISLYFENQFMLITVDLRIKRKFKERTLFYTLRAFTLLIGGIIGAIIGTSIGFAWGFVSGGALAYIILIWKRRELLYISHNTDMVKSLKSIWLPMTLAACIAVAGPYINRIVLSIWNSYSDVADLFAATSVMFMFAIPATCGSFVLLSMLARYQSVKELSSQAIKQCVILIIILTLSLPLILKFFGPVAIKLLYPTFGNSALEILRLVTWALPFVVLTDLTRPFVLKFSNIKVIPIINTISLLTTLISSIVLVPIYGAIGAAWAIVIGQGVTGLSWFLVACLLITGLQNFLISRFSLLRTYSRKSEF